MANRNLELVDDEMAHRTAAMRSDIKHKDEMIELEVRRREEQEGHDARRQATALLQF